MKKGLFVYGRKECVCTWEEGGEEGVHLSYVCPVATMTGSAISSMLIGQ